MKKDAVDQVASAGVGWNLQGRFNHITINISTKTKKQHIK